MFKTTLKSVAVAPSFLAATLLILTAVDGAMDIAASAKDTYLKVTVVDLDGLPVHNAKVMIGDQHFFTDNKGMSPSVQLNALSNCYDDAIADWGTVTVAVTCDGYTPSFVFNCIVYRSSTRRLTVKMYPSDGSELPYVSYVEAPPDDYIKSLLKDAA